MALDRRTFGLGIGSSIGAAVGGLIGGGIGSLAFGAGAIPGALIGAAMGIVIVGSITGMLGYLLGKKLDGQEELENIRKQETKKQEEEANNKVKNELEKINTMAAWLETNNSYNKLSENDTLFTSIDGLNNTQKKLYWHQFKLYAANNNGNEEEINRYQMEIDHLAKQRAKEILQPRHDSETLRKLSTSSDAHFEKIIENKLPITNENFKDFFSHIMVKSVLWLNNKLFGKSEQKKEELPLSVNQKQLNEVLLEIKDLREALEQHNANTIERQARIRAQVSTIQSGISQQQYKEARKHGIVTEEESKNDKKEESTAKSEPTLSSSDEPKP